VETKVEMILELIDPSGKVLARHTPTILFESNKIRMRMIAKINSFLMTKPGLYVYRLGLKQGESAVEKEIIKLPIEVKILI
jgi:hypothetical protein